MRSLLLNDTSTTEIYTLSLHDALPICVTTGRGHSYQAYPAAGATGPESGGLATPAARGFPNVAGSGQGSAQGEDRKSTRLNSSHTVISYAVFCLKKKNKKKRQKCEIST